MNSRDPLNSLSVEDVLNQDACAEHERLKTALWDHLVRLDNNVSVLEDLTSFPGIKLMGAGRRVLDLTGQNVYEYTILIVWRLWADPDTDSITLKRLQTLLFKNVRDEYREALKRRLRSLKPSPELRDIFERATAVRHGRLAHIDRGYSFNAARTVAGISVTDLRRTTDFIAEYFNGLQFGTHSMFSLAAFERGPGRRSHTERMLEDLVLRGPYSRRYDNYGLERWWMGFGARLTSTEVAWLSDLRVREGLPPIDPNPAT